jgi:polyphosphate glucokinase
MEYQQILGIDFGGSGIKGAPVDINNGKLADERVRFETPEVSSPENILDIILNILDSFNWKGPVGLAFPSLVKKGVVKSAANIDKTWIGKDAQAFFTKESGRPFYVVNDADAAGVAEIELGEGKGFDGSIVFLTVGTGIGTALFVSGFLFPNTEVGHIIFNGYDAELLVSDAARKKEDLKWKHWAPRFNEYLRYLEKLLNPDLFIIGGGMSKKEEKIREHITIKTPVKMAKLQNEAGIIGAAMYAHREMKVVGF